MGATSRLVSTTRRQAQWTAIGRGGRWLLFVLFMLYVGVALLWLLLGLLPVLAARIEPVQAFLGMLRDGSRSFSGTSVLLRGIWLVSFGFRDEPLFAIAIQYLFSVANIALGILLVRLRPWDRVAWLLALGMVGTGAIFNAQPHLLLNHAPRWVNDLHEVLHVFAGATYALALLLFPTGTLPPSPFPNIHLPRWLDWPLRVFLILFVALFGWGAIGEMHGEPVSFVAFFGILVPLLGGLAQIFRYRRAMSEVERQQTRTLLFVLLLGAMVAFVILGVALVLTASGLRLTRQTELTLERVAFVVFPLLFTAIPISLTFIVLRYRLWELNLAINRSLIYSTLTVAVGALYVLTVAAVGSLLEDRWIWLPSMLSVAVIAILIHPLRARVQSGVNRLMYGDRDDPVGVLARLGQTLEATATADEALPTIAETVARALKIPYVAIDVKRGGRFEETASYGTVDRAAPGAVESFPLVDHGEVVGQLRVAPRTPNEPFHRADRRLLTNLAHQAGPVVHAVLLTEALQRSRLRLVTAREEERRRLRRDLHDGLGPQLASLSLKVDAARTHLHTDPVRSEQLLTEVKEQIALAIADVRRTVYGLRPPALDQLGLISAIHEHVRRQGEQNNLQIQIVGPETLPPLPAAVEVAAYHVVLEALTNVVRHARAHHCYVGFCLSDAIHLVIADDGAGLPGQYQAGVGLTSMRERVDELGGHFQIRSEAGRGTRIEVNLPVPATTSPGLDPAYPSEHQ